MIAKIIKGKDFYGVLAYNDKKVEEGRGQGRAKFRDSEYRPQRPLAMCMVLATRSSKARRGR